MYVYTTHYLIIQNNVYYRMIPMSPEKHNGCVLLYSKYTPLIHIAQDDAESNINSKKEREKNEIDFMNETTATTSNITTGSSSTIIIAATTTIIRQAAHVYAHLCPLRVYARTTGMPSPPTRIHRAAVVVVVAAAATVALPPLHENQSGSKP